MLGLTAPQKRVLDFVKAYIAEHDGISPNYEEIARSISPNASKSNAARQIRELVERGHLARLPGRRRTLSVVQPTSSPGATVDLSNAERFQKIDDEIRRNYLAITGALDTQTNIAIQRIAIAAIQESDDVRLAAKLRLLAAALENTAHEHAPRR